VSEPDPPQPVNPEPPSLEPGSLAWRITIATLAHRFFGLIHDETTAKLIEQPADAGQANAWPVAYFLLYLQKSGIPAGEGFGYGRILGAMERAGLLMNCGWRHDMIGFPMVGQLYISQGSRSAQTTGTLWLSEALGFELVVGVYSALTVQVSGGEGKPAGSGLVVDRNHVITNRHVVTGLVGHDVYEPMEIRPSFKPPGAQWISRPSRIHARMDIDVAVIEVEVAENEGFFSIPFPRTVFRDPRQHDELRVLGYPLTLGFTEQPLIVEPGHVVNPAVEVPAMFGEPEHKVFLTSAVERPGNSGGPIVAQDGRVVGLVVEHNRSANQAGAGPSASDSSPFYRGIPAGEVVRAIESLDFTDLITLENPTA
jgi:S1-C subfamily serine protease